LVRSVKEVRPSSPWTGSGGKEVSAAAEQDE
jgi:hypothetical protein